MWNPSATDSILGFFKTFIGTPALLVGVFALLGCILMKKSKSQTIISVTKVIVGFLVIGLAAGGIKDVISHLFVVLKNSFGLGGTSALIPSNEVILTYIMANSPNIVTTATLILVFGMVMNVVLAKFSRLKYIYLTGHIMFYTSLAIASTQYAIGLRSIDNVADTVVCIFSGMFLLALWLTISPAINQKFVKKIVKNNNIAIGHSGGILYAMSGVIGIGVKKLSKKPIKSSEEIKVKKGLMFLTNGVVAMAITMALIYCTVMWIGMGIKGLDSFNTGPKTSLLGKGNDVNWGHAIWYPFLQGLMFSAGVQALIFGVKMFLSELIPSFEGISKKMVPGSKPAVEVQAFWGFAPNAIIIGIISSFLGGLAAFGIVVGIRSGISNINTKDYFPIMIPELIPHLFIGTTAAIWGNSFGGWKGAILGSFCTGIGIEIAPILFYDVGMMPTKLVTESKGVFADPGFLPPTIVTKISGWNASAISWSKWIILSLSTILYSLPIFYNYFMPKPKKQKEEDNTKNNITNVLDKLSSKSGTKL